MERIPQSSGEELRLDLVATDDLDAQQPVGVASREHRGVGRLAIGELNVGDADAEPAHDHCDLRRRWTTTPRSESQVHSGGDQPAEHHRTDDIFRPTRAHRRGRDACRNKSNVGYGNEFRAVSHVPTAVATKKATDAAITTSRASLHRRPTTTAIKSKTPHSAQAVRSTSNKGSRPDGNAVSASFRALSTLDDRLRGTPATPAPQLWSTGATSPNHAGDTAAPTPARTASKRWRRRPEQSAVRTSVPAGALPSRRVRRRPGCQEVQSRRSSRPRRPHTTPRELCASSGHHARHSARGRGTVPSAAGAGGVSP
jgi:hypothetical protein